MLIDEIKKIKCDKSGLRKFGITMAVMAGIIGGFLWWKESDVYIYVFGAGLLFLVAGMVTPVSLKHVYKIWMALALVMGYFVSRIILTVFYYVVITPIAFFMRLSGKKFLDIKPDNKETYWMPKEPAQTDKQRYENQY